MILRPQVLAGTAVPIFQIVIPSYSQKWFDLKGRTTATMIMGICEPFLRVGLNADRGHRCSCEIVAQQTRLEMRWDS